ncbi:MAG: phage shock protein B [Spirochaetes bacterium]|nr:phage shock protein B [Spirochaetota bacterium]
MVNFYLTSIPFFLILFVKDLHALHERSFFRSIPIQNELFLFAVIFGFIFVLLLFLVIHYITSMKRENDFRLYLNLENMWNSSPMLEARQKAASFITDDLIHSKDAADKEMIRQAKVIIDFLNHIGLQVYQDIINFGHIYNLLGNEIMDYWENKNYRMLVQYGKHKSFPGDMSYWAGFEYLADACSTQRNYLADQLWVPAVMLPSYQERREQQGIQEKISFSKPSKNQSGLYYSLMFVFFLGFLCLLIFLWSYFFYYGYI